MCSADSIDRTIVYRCISDWVCYVHPLCVIQSQKLHGKEQFQHYSQWESGSQALSRRAGGPEKALRADYRETQKQMRELAAVKGNVDHFLGVTSVRQNKEQAG